MLMAIICTLAALGLLWTTICRVRRTTKATKREIRWSLCALAVTGLAVPWALWAKPEALDGAVTLLLLSVLAVQVTTSTAWRGGVPRQYQE